MRAAQTVTRFTRMYQGKPETIADVRADIREFLAGSPVIDDATLVTSELSANASLHSRSAGDFFTVSVERHADYVFIEITDNGGYWIPDSGGGMHPHGLELIELIAGADGWGIDGSSASRVVWARLLSGAGSEPR